VSTAATSLRTGTSGPPPRALAGRHEALPENDGERPFPDRGDSRSGGFGRAIARVRLRARQSTCGQDGRSGPPSIRLSAPPARRSCARGHYRVATKRGELASRRSPSESKNVAGRASRRGARRTDWDVGHRQAPAGPPPRPLLSSVAEITMRARSDSTSRIMPEQGEPASSAASADRQD